MTIIQPGYRLTITSWENDGDNYRTKILDGLTKEETKFVVGLINLLKSRYNHKNCHGNLYDPSEEELEALAVAIKSVVAKHPISKFRFKEYFEGDVHSKYYLNGPIEFFYDIGLSCGEFYTRVLEEFTVEFIPGEIHIEDVTHEFFV